MTMPSASGERFNFLLAEPFVGRRGEPLIGEATGEPNDAADGESWFASSSLSVSSVGENHPSFWLWSSLIPLGSEAAEEVR
jgi:hypothetical protein